jgi:hypothetical protein
MAVESQWERHFFLVFVCLKSSQKVSGFFCDAFLFHVEALLEGLEALKVLTGPQ